MAERIKDAEDRYLESLFESAPVADDGFSRRVVGKVRRRLWLRRLALPVAATIGGVIAFEPVSTLAKAAIGLSTLLPQEFLGNMLEFVPQAQTIVLGAMLLAVCMLGLRTLED